jgi:hypothetical protein
MKNGNFDLDKIIPECGDDGIWDDNHHSIKQNLSKKELIKFAASIPLCDQYQFLVTEWGEDDETTQDYLDEWLEQNENRR